MQKERRDVPKREPKELTPEIEYVMDLLLDLAWMPGYPVDARQFDVVSRLYAEFVCIEPKTHGKLGEVIPSDWLIDKIAKTCARFPAPIQARMIYCKFFPPEDGLEPGVLKEQVPIKLRESLDE